MIRNSASDNIVQCFSNHQSIAVDESNKRIGTLLDVPNQFSVEYKLALVKFG